MAKLFFYQSFVLYGIPHYRHATDMCIYMHVDAHIHKDIHQDRQTDRKTDRDTHIHTYIVTYTHIQIDILQ